jgi:hypothetical protein
VTVEAVPVELAVSAPARVVAPVGGHSRIELTVANVGAADAADVVVGVTAPAGLSLVSDQCSAGPGDITCALGAVPVGRSGVLVLEAQADGSVVGDLVDGLTVTVTATDVAPLVSQVPITVVAPKLAFTPDSLATVVLDPDPADGPHDGTVTFAVANTGGADARNVVTTVLLPAGITFVPDGEGGGHDGSGTLVRSLGDLAPGATVPVVLRVHVEDASSLAVQISVGATRVDPIVLATR